MATEGCRTPLLQDFADMGGRDGRINDLADARGSRCDSSCFNGLVSTREGVPGSEAEF